MDRRTTARRYDALLPAFFPIKPVGGFVALDFMVGGIPGGGGSASGRDPHRDLDPALDTRVSPRRMLAWLRSMPSYRAGVPLRIGHGADAGLAFDKGAELIELLDPGRPVVYRTRHPLSRPQRAFFAAPRPNLQLELTASPGGDAGGAGAALELVRSAAGLDPRAVHWVVGPLTEEGEAAAARLLEALPLGSRLTLRPLAAGDDRAARGAAPAGPAALARLEAAALARGLVVSDWSCRGGQARVGRGFCDVDRVTGQSDLARRAHDLITCAACPSRTQCHGLLDEPALLARLERELQVVGLTRTAPPVRTGLRAFQVEVAEPTAPGDEAYLSHALGQPVAISLSTCRPAAGEAGGLGDLDPAVLRRWYGTGFLPVTELNAAAEKVLEDLARRQARGGPSPALDPAASRTG